MQPSVAPTVSVLLPAYNHEAFVGEALRSVLGQTFDDLELIVVDDGSADGTASVLAEWAALDERVHIVTRDGHPNLGLATSLQELALRARGEYIAQISSDDVWLPQKLERQLADASSDHPWSYGRALPIGPTGEITGPAFGSAPDGPMLDRLLRSNPVPSTTVIYRRDLYLRSGGYNPQAPAEDYDLWLRFASLEEPSFIDEPVTLVRILPRSLTSALRATVGMSEVNAVAVGALLAWIDLPPEHRAKVAVAARVHRLLAEFVAGRVTHVHLDDAERAALGHVLNARAAELHADLGPGVIRQLVIAVGGRALLRSPDFADLARFASVRAVLKDVARSARARHWTRARTLVRSL